MRVVVAGGHGQIGRRLLRLLVDAGHQAVGLVRNPDHGDHVCAAGAEAAVIDLEHSDVEAVAAVLGGADAVVFAAGAGPGSGATRKQSMDRDGAVLLADAAVAAAVPRYLMVSSVNAVEPDDEDAADSDDVFQIYLRAKGAADVAVRSRGLDWVVLRPGQLTDDPGTNRVRLSASVPGGAVPRDDVAAVLLALLVAGTSGVTLELAAGDTEVESAVRAL